MAATAAAAAAWRKSITIYITYALPALYAFVRFWFALRFVVGAHAFVASILCAVWQHVYTVPALLTSCVLVLAACSIVAWPYL